MNVVTACVVLAGIAASVSLAGFVYGFLRDSTLALIVSLVAVTVAMFASVAGLLLDVWRTGLMTC